MPSSSGTGSPRGGEGAGRAIVRVMRSARALEDEAASWRRGGRRVALVPTMGALHAGHLGLVERARRDCDTLVVSVFVNPSQFAPGEDLARYPRAFEADERACRGAGVDVLFAPAAGEIYPPGFCTWVDPGGPALPLEGRIRPGHFRGVATVVLRLFEIARPDLAVFGQKDAQQVAVVLRMVRDLGLPVQVVVAPTVREADGLALSSRNRYLTPRQRAQAPALHRALEAAAALHARGERRAARLRQAVRRALASARGLKTEYAEVVDAETFARLADAGHERALLVAAARLGRVRLIDNRPLGPGAGPL